MSRLNIHRGRHIAPFLQLVNSSVILGRHTTPYVNEVITSSLSQPENVLSATARPQIGHIEVCRNSGHNGLSYRFMLAWIYQLLDSIQVTKKIIDIHDQEIRYLEQNIICFLRALLQKVSKAG